MTDVAAGEAADDAYDDDDDDDRKWKDDYDGEDDGPQLPQVSPQLPFSAVARSGRLSHRKCAPSRCSYVVANDLQTASTSQCAG